MTLLPKVKGQRAGRIVVYGEQSVPILSAARPEDVVMAAGQLGPRNGRVVVLSHHRYVGSFCSQSDQGIKSIFHENINHWVTRGEFANKHQVVFLPGHTDLSDILLKKMKILVWDSSREQASPQLEKEVLGFVNNGGALIYAICPHKWKVRNQSKSMEEMPLGNILAKIGVTFCDYKVSYSVKGEGFSIDSSQALQQALSHAHHLVQECLKETQGHILQQNALRFVNFFREAPASVKEILKDKFYTLFAKCNEVVDTAIPHPDSKISDQRSLSALVMAGALSEMEMGYQKMPGIENFPGAIEEDKVEILKCADLEIKSTGRETHPTGYWVPAGNKFEVKVISQMGSEEEPTDSSDDDTDSDDEDDDADRWVLTIGSHSDTLNHKDSLKRWPSLVVKARLTSRLRVFTPYGGLLYFVSPRSASQISVQISGVVEAPFFDLKEPVTVESWESIRNAPAPWADICGQWFRITVPSHTIRELDNPTQVMQVRGHGRSERSREVRGHGRSEGLL